MCCGLGGTQDIRAEQRKKDILKTVPYFKKATWVSDPREKSHGQASPRVGRSLEWGYRTLLGVN